MANAAGQVCFRPRKAVGVQRAHLHFDHLARFTTLHPGRPRQLAPEARIIVMTTYSGDVQALRALKAGAAGFLLKNSVRKELVDAIRIVWSGRRYLSAGIAAEIATHALDEPLTTREIEILRLIAGGDANKQVARKLGVTDETVKAYLKSIFAKLNVADRTHAVTLAAKRGIIEL
jgi:DNA-binding NarL/FixJ family response regulator